MSEFSSPPAPGYRMQADALVVGGGVIGLTTALALIDAGLTVTVVDPGTRQGSASPAGGGILSPLSPWRNPASLTALVCDSQASYPALARRLREVTGVDVEWLQSGMLILDPDDGVADWAAAGHSNAELLDARACAVLEPAAAGVSNAVYLPQVAQVRNPRLLIALQRCLVALGATLLRDTATAIRVDDGQAAGVTTSAGVIDAATVVVAAGVWSRALLQPLGVDLDLRPVRGQMIWYRPAPGRPRHILRRGDAYLIPRVDGVCLVGSTLEDAGFETTITDAARDTLMAAAAGMAPAMADEVPAGQWCGLRPASPAPISGACSDLPGVYVNTGHFRNGITVAPAAAVRLAAMIVAQTVAAPVVDGGGRLD